MNYRIKPMEDKPRARCRLWAVFVNTGKRNSKGRLIWREKRLSGTYSEIQEQAEALVEQYEQEETLVPAAWTFEEYAEHWNSSRFASGLISKATYQKNSHLLKAMALHLGTLKLKDVSIAAIEAATIALKEGKSPSGKPLSGTTLACVHTVCNAMMAHALNCGLIAANPFECAESPKPDTAERKALDMVEEVELSLALDATDAHHLAIIIMLEAGLRRGECCALEWQDVKDNALSISKSMRNDGTIGTTKTGKTRLIPISTTLKTALERRRTFQREDMAQEGLHITPDTPILANCYGEPMRPHVLGRWWSRNRASFGLDGWTLHEFRHTYCSNLAEASIHPKVMQSLMGHASEKTCMQVYTHVHNEQLKEAMEALDKAKIERLHKA